MPARSLEQIVSLARRRGFIFAGSEIYGGLQGIFDYGPLGVELKNNITNDWWRTNVYERDDMEGLDASILMNRLVWRYSGHEETFNDPLVDCRACKGRWRADHLRGHCPACGSSDLTEPRPFNMMFRTANGRLTAAEALVLIGTSGISEVTDALSAIGLLPVPPRQQSHCPRDPIHNERRSS